MDRISRWFFPSMEEERTDQDEPIKTFTDTPAYPDTKKDKPTPEKISEAEEQIEEKEDKDAGRDQESEETNKVGDFDTTGVDESDTDMETGESDEDEQGTGEDNEQKTKDDRENDSDGEGDRSDDSSEDSSASSDSSPKMQIWCTHYTERELEDFTPGQLAQIKIVRFEYGTPSGIDHSSSPSGGCTHCGTADVGDVAIIDAEIDDGGEEADETGVSEDLNIGSTEEVANEGTEEEEGGMGEELELYIDLRTKAMHYLDMKAEYGDIDPMLFAAQEDFASVVNTMLGVLKKVMFKVAKYARRTYLFTRNKLGKVFLSLRTLQKLWNLKVKVSINGVSEEDLSKWECTALRFDDWKKAVQLGVMAYDIAAKGEYVVFDSENHTITRAMQDFKRQCEQLDIEFNIAKGVVKIGGLVDRRDMGSLARLGYSRGNVVAAMRHLGEITERVPNPKDALLEKKTNQIIEKMTLAAKETNEAIVSGEIVKGTPAYQEAADKMLDRTVRMDFILACSRLAYSLFELCSKDMLAVLEKFEDAYDPDAITDA